MAVTFEGYERRIDKITKTCEKYGIANLEDALKICTDSASTHMTSRPTFSPSRSRTPSGPIPSVVRLPSRRTPRPPRRPQRPSAKASRPSASPAPWPRTARSVSAMAILAPCSSARTPSASRSWPVTSPSQPPRVPSASPTTPTGPQEAPARHPERPWQGRRPDHRPHQRLHLRPDPVRLLHQRAPHRQDLPYSDGPRAEVNCYGADDVREGVAIMWHEKVDISITGNSTNPTRFQHPSRVPTSRSACLPARSTSPWRLVAALVVPCTPKHGRRSRLLRHDRHHGPHAFERSVRRLQLRPGARRHDGSHRHGQQPHGRLHRGLRRGCRAGSQRLVPGHSLRHESATLTVADFCVSRRAA